MGVVGLGRIGTHHVKTLHGLDGVSVSVTDADPQRYGLACRVAEAQIDLVRVRHVRRDLLDSVVGHPKDAARLRSASDRAGILSKRTEPKIEDPDYAQAPNGTPARDQ